MKKKQSENYLEYVPQRTPETEFTEDEAGIVTLTKEWTGFYNRIAQRFFHRPRVSHIDPDGYGSFIWKLIDGKRTVYDISRKLDEAYPGMEKSPVPAHQVPGDPAGPPLHRLEKRGEKAK